MAEIMHTSRNGNWILQHVFLLMTLPDTRSRMPSNVMKSRSLYSWLSKLVASIRSGGHYYVTQVIEGTVNNGRPSYLEVGLQTASVCPILYCIRVQKFIVDATERHYKSYRTGINIPDQLFSVTYDQMR